MSLPYSAPYGTPVVDADGYINPLWAAFFDNFVSASGAQEMPSGAVILFDGSAEPAGWLYCDGREVSRRFYNSLFLAIGTRYGAGDGLTTFNIPDRREKFIRGTASIGTVDSGGEESYILDIANLPAITVDVTDPGHTHVFAGAATAVPITDPGHVHTITDPGHTHTQGATSAASTTAVTGANATYSTSNTGSATTGVTVNSGTTGITIAPITPLGSNSSANTGVTASIAGTASEPLNITPPYMSISFLIKT